MLVLDPCDTTFINKDGSFKLPAQISVQEGNEKLKLVVNGPTDSISEVYAPSKFDFCGPMSYDLVFLDGL